MCIRTHPVGVWTDVHKKIVTPPIRVVSFLAEDEIGFERAAPVGTLVKIVRSTKGPHKAEWPLGGEEAQWLRVDVPRKGNGTKQHLR